MKKKLLCFLTSAVMTATCIAGGLSELTSRIHLVIEPLTAEAVTYGEEMKYGDYLYYKTVDEDEDGTSDYVEISGCDTSVIEVEIPNEIDGLSVTNIGKDAFFNCSNLRCITISDSVKSIGNTAFWDCQSLEKLIIANGSETITTNMINGGMAMHIKEVIIPDSVKSIESEAFYGCSYLKSVTISDSVASIADDAFRKCTSLEQLIISNGSETITAEMTNGMEPYIKEVIIPDSVTSIENFAFSSCLNLESINVSGNNNYYCSIDGILFNKNKTALIQYPIGNEKTEYSVPNSVTSIGYEAFSRCENLSFIIIPDSVTNIEDYAFCRCTNLTSITIPDKVPSIGTSAFEYCISLESITIPNSVTRIGYYAFSGCTSLADITIENPDCTIHDSEYTISDTATIYGYENSTAQAYAENYNREFISLGEKPAVIKGDANGDGKITAADIILIQKYLVKIEIAFEVDFTVLDINEDGTFNVFDVILLKRMIMNT